MTLRVTITTGIFPPDVGGPASSVPGVASWLRERGHEVTVVCASDRLDHDDSAYPFHVIRVPRRLSRPRRSAAVLRAVLVRAGRTDVVYANGLPVAAALAARFAGLPLVHKVVGDFAWERARTRGRFDGTMEEYQGARKGLRLRALDVLRNAPLRGAESIIVPSVFLGRMVAGWGIPERRIVVIPNAAAPVVPREPDTRLPPFVGKTMVTACRLVPWKGVEGLIDAVAALADLRLTVLGDGPLRGALAARAEAAGVGARVHLLGDVPRAEVEHHLRGADLFVLNSSYEGLPHVVLEAMQAGAPVVATDAGGTRELVEDGVTGRLVPAGDAAALQGAIREVLDDPAAAAARASAARRMVSERFSFDEMARRTEAVLVRSCPCAAGRQRAPGAP